MRGNPEKLPKKHKFPIHMLKRPRRANIRIFTDRWENLKEELPEKLNKHWFTFMEEGTRKPSRNTGDQVSFK